MDFFGEDPFTQLGVPGARHARFCHRLSSLLTSLPSVEPAWPIPWCRGLPGGFSLAYRTKRPQRNSARLHGPRSQALLIPFDHSPPWLRRLPQDIEVRSIIRIEAHRFPICRFQHDVDSAIVCEPG